MPIIAFDYRICRFQTSANRTSYRRILVTEGIRRQRLSFGSLGELEDHGERGLVRERDILARLPISQIREVTAAAIAGVTLSV